jgi:hypothetical protein
LLLVWTQAAETDKKPLKMYRNPTYVPITEESNRSIRYASNNPIATRAAE